MMEINKFDFIVMAILNANHADHPLRGMTIKDIEESEEMVKSESVYYRTLCKLERDGGYIAKGAKDGKAHAYYITSVGKNYIKKITEGERE